MTSVDVLIPTILRDTLDRSIDSAVGQDAEAKVRVSVMRSSTAGPADCSRISATRNKLAAETDGEWIAFLDDDDYWNVDYLSKALSPQFTGSDIIFSSHVEGRSRLGDVGKILLLGGIVCGASGIVMRRSAFDMLGGFDAVPHSEVWHLLVKAMVAGMTFAYQPQKTWTREYQRLDHASKMFDHETVMRDRKELLRERGLAGY